ncbi:T9SS sorting signal type C domain-containing protein [Moheibacter stercoris]|uniref:Por secretion system C-terminal sorting domain-containing protein n=1 Tax=Moheibacter stercoris TaxID=1628251 RepID=A0ABV2LTU4_9FLAO
MKLQYFYYTLRVIIILLLPLKLLAQEPVVLYQQNFDGNNGNFTNSIVSATTPVNGWRASSTSTQYGNYRHLWNFSNLGSGNFAPISGRSLGMGFYNGNNPNYPENPFRTWNGTTDINALTTRWAHVGFSTVGYENITIEFKWRCTGEVDSGKVYDYGTVNTSIDNGNTWSMDMSGGIGGETGEHGIFPSGLYYNNSGVQTANLTLDETRANQPNFRLAFRMVVDDWYGTGGGFIVDDIIVRGTPISSDRTLTVSEAYTGASYANGNHTISNNTSVTATSGTRAGYVVTGWTGTGSVPATGTGGTANFTITENSSINWLWEQTETPKNITFYNYGGDDQLAFNNSRIETNTPIFRISHQDYDATDYQVEINSNATFTGTSWTQTFTGAYPVNSEANFAFNNNFTPTNNTTYYVRARVKGAANVWSAWTTETYSFTYQTPQDIPDWFQTTQAQFASNTLSGVEANASHHVVVSSGSGNPILNPSFETNTNWTSFKSTGSPLNVEVNNSGNWSSEGTRAARMHMFGGNPFSGDLAIVSQVVDLTNVEQIIFDTRSMYGPNWSSSLSNGGTLRLIIGGSSSNATGNVYATVNHCASGSSSCNVQMLNITANIPLAERIPNQTIKFVWSGFSSGDLGGALVDFMVDNVRAISPSSGTITSTPIHLASVQDAEGYEGITWNQTLNGGTMTLKVQESPDGISGWTDVAGHTNISSTGDGPQTYDLNGFDVPHIRLVGVLNGTGVTLHDWSVQFEREDDCANSTTWDGTDWSNGVPSDLTKRIIFNGNYTSDTNNTNGGALVGCSIEVQSGNVEISSNHHIIIENEIVVSGGSFTLENNANLVQNSVDAVNVGNITVKRISAPMVRQDATGWSSPVAGQNVRSFSPYTLKKRYYIYNGYGDAGAQGSSFKGLFEFDPLYPMPNPIPSGWEGDKITVNGRELFNEQSYTFQKGWGYSIRVPNTWSSTNPATFEGVFTGVPQNGDFEVKAYGKYSMVGNPYPSSINANSFLTDNPPVETLHFWTHYYPVGHTSYDSNYATYTLAGGAGTSHPDQNADVPNGIIPIGQGFVIQNLNNIPEESNIPWNVSFKNSMRSIASNGIFYKTDDELERHRFWLSLTNQNNDQLAQILVAYMTDATQGYDHQIDGRRMGGAALYSLIDSLDFTVQGRSLPFELEDVVPLGFKSFSDSKYAISIDDVDGFFAEGEVQIFIRDKFLSIEHNLSSSDYEFETVEGEFLDRFEIIYKTEEVLDTEENLFNAIQIYHEGANIMVKSSKEKILSVELWDISGRKLHQNQKVNSHLYSIPKSNFGTQVLLVTVMTENGEITRKKIINS